MGTKKRTDREKFTESVTVQERDCEEFILVPVSFLKSLREEIDGLRSQFGLPSRQWEPSRAASGAPEDGQ